MEVAEKLDNISNGVLTVDVPGDQWYRPTNNAQSGNDHYSHLTAYTADMHVIQCTTGTKEWKLFLIINIKNSNSQQTQTQ